jgi:ABC-2 type transport system permease protein
MITLAKQTWWMTVRRLAVFVRQPWYLLITLVQPVIWLYLFGNLFRSIVNLPGFHAPSYLDYLVPGIVIMNAMSVNMWAGMTMLEEIDRGTLNRFLITPVSRGAIINATVVEQAVSTVVQSVIIVLLGLVSGAHYPGGVGGVAVLIAAAVLLGALFGALSNTVGMLAQQRETIIGMYTFLSLPLAFLSSAFMPPDLMPHWMRLIAQANPVNWALVASRDALESAADWGAVGRYGVLLVAVAAVLVWLSTRTFRAYQKAV